MKQCFTLLVLLIASIFPTTAQIELDLIGEFPFSGNADNASGWMQNGFLIGDVAETTDRFDNQNCAYAFTGSDSSYIYIPFIDSLNFGENGFSVSLWYKGGSDNPGDLEFLCAKGETNAADFVLALYDLNKPLFAGLDSPDPFSLWHNDNELFGSEQWHHLVAVYDNNNAKLYFDGGLVNSQLDVTIEMISNIFYIGKFFEGSIDDLRIYNRAISDNDVGDLYTLAGSCTTTLGAFTNVAEDRLLLYPNPTTYLLHIPQLTHGDIALQIYDALGRCVLQENMLSNSKVTINISTLTRGIYSAIVVSSSGKARRGKFVVGH